MAAYLFGNNNRAVGSINGIPVTVKTETGSFSAKKTTVTIGEKELVFNSRRDALEYLRNLAKTKEMRPENE